MPRPLQRLKKPKNKPTIQQSLQNGKKDLHMHNMPIHKHLPLKIQILQPMQNIKKPIKRQTPNKSSRKNLNLLNLPHNKQLRQNSKRFQNNTKSPRILKIRMISKSDVENYSQKNRKWVYCFVVGKIIVDFVVGY